METCNSQLAEHKFQGVENETTGWKQLQKFSQTVNIKKIQEILG